MKAHAAERLSACVFFSIIMLFHAAQLFARQAQDEWIKVFFNMQAANDYLPGIPPVIQDDLISTFTDLATLQLLPGIGKTYSDRIIAYRIEQGGFKKVEELINIKGIGEKRLAKIRPIISL